MQTGPQLSVVIPIYNEEAILQRNIGVLAAHLDARLGDACWQLVLVDNGSTDQTVALAQEIISARPASKFIRLPKPNIGEAQRAGLLEADAPWCHLSGLEEWDLPFLDWAWQSREEYDLLIGSKRADPTINSQASYRRFLSWVLNVLLQRMFDYVASDTHGPKLIRLETMRPILEICLLRRGQFDSEFCIRAFRKGLWIAEAPIELQEQRPPRNFMMTKILRNMHDVWRMRGILENVPSESMTNYRRFARTDVLADIGSTANIHVLPQEQRRAEA